MISFDNSKLSFSNVEDYSEKSIWEKVGRESASRISEDLKFLLFRLPLEEKKLVIEKIQNGVDRFEFLDERVILLKLLKGLCFSSYLYPNRHLDNCIFSLDGFLKVIDTLLDSYKIAMENKSDFVKRMLDLSMILTDDNSTFIFRTILSARSLVEDDNELLEILDQPRGSWSTFLELLEIETSRVLARKNGLTEVSWRTAKLIFPINVYLMED